MTHGHPDGWGPSGFIAAAVRRALIGEALSDAISGALADLRQATADYRRAPSTQPYEDARRLAGDAGADAPTQIRQLGEGWTGRKPLPSLHIRRSAEPVSNVVARAANHDGDSDSTASIAGQLWGAAHGLEGLPHDWVCKLDVLDEILEYIENTK